MARFLSAAWFEELREHTGAVADQRSPGTPLVTQVVTGTPDGEVRYQVLVEGTALRVRPAAQLTAPLTFTSDYLTAAAIARGELTTETALLEGRLRVSGNSTWTAEHLDLLAGANLVPAGVRASTTY